MLRLLPPSCIGIYQHGAFEQCNCFNSNGPGCTQTPAFTRAHADKRQKVSSVSSSLGHEWHWQKMTVQ